MMSLVTTCCYYGLGVDRSHRLLVEKKADSFEIFVVDWSKLHWILISGRGNEVK